MLKIKHNMQFSKSQLDNLKKYIEIYKEYSKSEEYKKDISEREEKKGKMT